MFSATATRVCYKESLIPVIRGHDFYSCEYLFPVVFIVRGRSLDSLTSRPSLQGNKMKVKSEIRDRRYPLAGSYGLSVV